MLAALNYGNKRLTGINRKQSRHISPTISQVVDFVRQLSPADVITLT